MTVMVPLEYQKSILTGTRMRLMARRIDAPPSLPPLEWLTNARPTIRGQVLVIPLPHQALYGEQSPRVAVKKASQVFVSEWLINMALWCADTKQGRRGNVLYIFPVKESMGDFVRARIDPAIEESLYLQDRVRPIRGIQMRGTPSAQMTDNVGMKRVGASFIYLRGSNSQSGLLTVDADLVIYDEVDRLAEGTLDLGAKRLGSSLLAWQRYASTPTFPGVGIDALWEKSDQRHWMVTCECGREQEPASPDSIDDDGNCVCVGCRRVLRPWESGRWVAARPGADTHGFHITRFMSPRADLKAIRALHLAIIAREVTSQSTVQEFWNQDCGLAFAPEGGQLTRAEIDACTADYALGEWLPRGCAMGVDVGARLHVRIDAPSPTEPRKSRAAVIRTCEWGDLSGLMAQYDVNCAVIDSQPEMHLARAFAQKFPGRVWLCNYPDPATWSHMQPVVWDVEGRTAAAHRTLTLDAMYAEIRERRIELPRGAADIPEYAPHMMAPVRIVEKDAKGNMIGRYVEAGRPDHFAHASNYAMIARLRGRGLPFGWIADDKVKVRAV